MNKLTKTIIAAVGALLLSAAPAVANAERVFFLVGTRHVYRIGTYEYAHLDERKKIEQDYADQVAADQDQYNKAIAGGADPAKESADFNSALNDLAVQRDQQLGAIFENADYERVRHPELQIQGDGPYQVMGINFHYHGSVEVFDNFMVYAPWPGYVVVGRPYGWSFGVVYSPFQFHHLYLGWYSGFVALGSPAFVGLVGFHGPVNVIGFSRGPRGVFYAPHGGVGRVIGGRSGGSFGRSSYSHTLGGGSRTTTTRSGGSSFGRSSYSHTMGGSRTTTHSSFGGSHAITRSSTNVTQSSFGGGRSSSHSSGRSFSSSHSSFGRSGSTHTSSGGHGGSKSHGHR